MSKLKLSLNLLILISVIQFISCNKDETPVTVNTSDIVFSIDENPVKDQVIGTVTGITNIGSVSFSIQSQSPERAFTINSASGELSVLDKELFDFEVNATISGVVAVSNGDIVKQSNVTINVTDLDETIFVGDVTLTTQEEIDAFGAKNYLSINGNLTINEDQVVHDIVFFSPLETITSITGVVKIENLYNLLDIPSLNNLTSVGGIVIDNNWGILDIHSLSNLTTCSGSISITNNGELGSLCGIRPLLQSGNFSGTYTVSGNLFNPTQQEVIDGDCE